MNSNTFQFFSIPWLVNETTVYTLLKWNNLFSLLETEHLKQGLFVWFFFFLEKHTCVNTEGEIAIDQKSKKFLFAWFSA